MTIIWSGLGAGATYALLALVFNIALSISGVFNFAQPQYVMVGAFLGYAGTTQLGLPFPVVIAGSLVIGGLVGLIEYQVAIKTLRTARGYAALVTTVGFAVLLQGVAILIWGITPQRVSIPGENDIFNVLGGRLPMPDLVTLVAAVVVTIALTVAYHRTRWGLASRAAMSDATAAQLRGVNVNRIRVGGFVLAGAIACAIGPVIGAQTTAYTDLGNNLLILGFVALTLGGYGSFAGSLIGGLVVGAIELITQRYLSGDNYWFILYALFLAILLVRPTGILGRRAVSRAV